MAMRIMPQSVLAKSEDPMADMMNLMTGGTWGGIFISIGVIVSIVGASNSGILIAERSAFTASVVAEIVLVVKHDDKINVGNFIKNSIVPLLGFAYVIYGSGAETVMWGLLLMLIGI
jgi:amino acid transporter